MSWSLLGFRNKKERAGALDSISKTKNRKGKCIAALHLVPLFRLKGAGGICGLAVVRS